MRHFPDILRDWLSGRSPPPAWFPLLVPLLVAVVVEWILWPLIKPQVWFVFYPAVFASSWLGGRVAGVQATALSVVLVWWLFVPPQYSWAKDSYSPLLTALVFAAMGIVFSLSHERLRRGEQRIRDLFDQAGDGIFLADIRGRYTDVNDAACRMLDCTREEIVGKNILDLIPAEEASRLHQAREELLAGATQVAEWRLRRKDGSYLPVEVSAKILPGGQWQAIARDISERRRAQEQLMQAAVVFESTNEGILVADAQHNITMVNRALTNMTGFEAHELIGANPRILQSGRHDAVFYRHFWDELLARGQWQGEIWNRRKNGEVYPAWENVSAVRDQNGTITHYVAVLADITSVKSAEERLNHLAHHDALTGLPNRLLFASSLEQSMEYAKRHRQKVALLFIDLDRFKVINDSMGHAAGDALLKEIGHRLKSTVRAEDVVTRFGGDEFTVALAEVPRADEVAGLAQQILEEIARPVSLAGRDIVVSASIGIALYPDDADTIDNLTRAADSAMYRAKEHGRSTFEFYTRDITERVLEHLSFEGGLRLALERDELRLHYQPLFEPAGRRIMGVEALLRWQHPEEGLIMPERFIPIAEQSGLINTIGVWVVRRACAQARAWREQGLAPVRVAVNISGRHIVHDHLADAVEDALRANGLGADDASLEIEITEGALDDVDPNSLVLQRLRALGVRIAIDDFGTGHSSLSLLKHLPIDTLKIDRLFVRNVPGDHDSAAIVSAVISMAHALGLRVVAEGVETEAQLAFLRGEGCDEVQGYLLGGPAPAEDIAPLLAGVKERQADGQLLPDGA